MFTFGRACTGSSGSSIRQFVARTGAGERQLNGIIN